MNWTQGLIAYDLARKLKLKHIVYHSVFRVEHFKDVPHFASNWLSKALCESFDVPFTIIRPNYFFQNDASLRDPLMKAGIYPMPLGTVGISAVDIRDMLRAAAIALHIRRPLWKKTYNLNGPEVLSGPKSWRASGAGRLARKFATLAKIWMPLKSRCESTPRPGQRSTSA